MTKPGDQERTFTPPWSRIESLSEMTAEAGIDFDSFVSDIKNEVDIKVMSEKYKVSEKTLENLIQHFFHYGISSVLGGD